MRFFLRTWYFQKATVKSDPAAIALGASSFALPADFGKGPLALRIRLVSDGTLVYKRLRKGNPGDLPHRLGPELYWVAGGNVVLDSPMPESGYEYELWYQSNDLDLAEPWLTTDFEDVLHIKAVMDLALTDARKPEVYQAFASAWQERAVGLGVYANEAEFNDIEMGMSPRSAGFLERYPSN
jgi:hypothetical protein